MIKWLGSNGWYKKEPCCSDKKVSFMNLKWFVFGIAMILLFLITIYYAQNSCYFNTAVQTFAVQSNEEGLEEISNASQEPLKAIVMTGLGNITDPEVNVPLAEVIGLTPEDVDVENGDVSIVINLPSYCPLKDRIISDIKESIGKIIGVESVEVKLKEEVEG
ncbi:hypothetical protein AYK26_06140 [Euryarchaeota archaeon SM23-78]|nr:MAG: hypothetical protein AYK26_06140 [Euryarchaeota archaeon SM23-78]MBW3001503.1 iron-sulfur cluster assembly protein [Candidatus Woesearchaeota archaeon]